MWDDSSWSWLLEIAGPALLDPDVPRRQAFVFVKPDPALQTENRDGSSSESSA